MQNLDSELLRTFLAILDAGSITGGALRINRSQSATSLQLKQLEETLGHKVFRRHGRGIAPTAIGEQLVITARKVIKTLDVALSEIRDEQLLGKLRIGLPEDHENNTLSKIVANFISTHPGVELEVHYALGTKFSSSLENGELDLVVQNIPKPSTSDVVLRIDTMHWMSAKTHDTHLQKPLSIAVFNQDCWWRDIAISNLEKNDISFRVVFTSDSINGIKTAISSGMAIGLLCENDASNEFIKVPNMSKGEKSYLVLQTSPTLKGPACEAMCNAIKRVFQK